MRDVGSGMFEFGERVAVGVAHGDKDEGLEAEAKGVGIEVCMVAAECSKARRRRWRKEGPLSNGANLVPSRCAGGQ